MSTNGRSGRGPDREALFRRTMDRAGELAAVRRRRQRLLVTAPAIVLVLALTAGVLAAVVGSSGTARHHLGAAGHQHLPTTVPSSTNPTSSTTSSSTTLPPPRPHVIKGFDPVSFTAVSLAQWWVIGYVPTAGPRLTIAQTTDGGSRFSTLRPPSGLSPDSNGAVEIRFADPNDGYVVGSSFWATTDDGSSWVRQDVSGSVTDVEASRGNAFAISCGSSSCSLLEEPVGSSGSGSWHAVSLPETLTPEASLSVVGSRVVVTNGIDQTKGVSFEISTDGGASFTTQSTPCYPGLGGHVVAAAMASSALWVSCPTGMMATPFRSSDNGSTWSSGNRGGRAAEFSNGLGIAPISASTALVWPFQHSSGALGLTTDGGQSFTSVLNRGTGATALWAGYSDSQRAYAIFSTGSYAGELWMSSDGGLTWSRVHFDS